MKSSVIADYGVLDRGSEPKCIPFGLEAFRLEGQKVTRRTEEQDGYRIVIETIADADTKEFETANVEMENLQNARTQSFSSSDLAYAYQLITEYKSRLVVPEDDAATHS